MSNAAGATDAAAMLSDDELAVATRKCFVSAAGVSVSAVKMLRLAPRTGNAIVVRGRACVHRKLWPWRVCVPRVV